MTESTSAAEGVADATTDRYRTHAGAAGALILIGYLTYGLPDVTLVQPLVDAADPLATVASDPTALTIGALVMAVNAAAVVGISLLLYPVLKPHDELIALGYVGTRLFEAIVMIGGIIGVLVLVPLSQEYVRASGADAAALQAVGTAAIQANVLAYHVAMIGLAVGSLPFCYLLYRTALVPRVLSVLGLIGYPALLTLMLVEIVGSGAGPMLSVLYVPGGLFEIGLALWLLVKGFNTPTIVATRSSSAAEPVE